MWKEIINDFNKIGLNIDNLFLENISNKNFDYIKSNINLIPIINHYFEGDNKNIIIKKNNKEFKFDILGFICKGSSNQTYLIRNNNNNKLSVYRCPLTESNQDIIIINNFIECFIHSFLSIIDEKYLTNKNKIIKLYQLGYNPKYKFISYFLDKMDGTLYSFIKCEEIDFNRIKNSSKLLILLKGIYEITCLIEELQEKLKFVHHDLKCDNIFYKKIDNKYKFYLGDFDNSRIEIKKYIFKNQKTVIPDNDFYIKKDLFILTNSLYYSFNNKNWKDNFFYKFPVIESIINKKDNFYALYNYKDEMIDDIYIPSNYKIIIKDLIKKLI
jgi:serine/threonine protein kinase